LKRAYLSRDDKFMGAHQLAASLLDIAHARGVDHHRLVRGTGIFIEDVKVAKQISAEQVFRLIENAQKLVPGYDCSFQLGRRLFPGSYGAVSEALMHARDMTDALRIVSRLKMQICPFVSCLSYCHNKQVYLLINDALGSGKNWQFIVECYLTALSSSLRLLCGHRIPLHFELPFPRPRYIQEYEENLGFRVQFDQPMLTVRFESKWLCTRFQQDSKTLRQYALLNATQSQVPQLAFIDAVRQRLRSHPHTSLQQAAEYFSMSPATLKRKLKLHGNSFQELHDDVRRQQAIYLIKHKGLNNEQSATQMAFSDVPNFRRAVKRWTGLTPSQLKEA